MRKISALFLVLALTAPVAAENWPNWRGPQGESIAADADYPTEWGEEKNIQWKVKLPGWGTSTPAIWGDQIFVSCSDDQRNKNLLICLNRAGKKQWEVELGQMAASRNRKASGANSSPTTDGKHVYAYFKSGDLACVDLEGKIKWQMNLQTKYGRDALNWDLGTSPVLADGLVVVAVMHQGPSYVVALDKTTGKVEWKTERDLGAPAEARDSYSTPLVVQRNGQTYLVVLGGDNVTAYSAKDGEEQWRLGGLNPRQARNFRSIASPTMLGDTVFAPYARGATLTAAKWPQAKGNVTPKWTVDGSADVPTPVALNGRVYVCSDRGDVRCLDADSGEAIWTERLPRNRYAYSASPIVANGNLYTTREDGTTYVVELSNPPKVIATNALRENTYATPAFVDGKIYLRTSDYLFCIAKP